MKKQLYFLLKTLLFVIFFSFSIFNFTEAKNVVSDEAIIKRDINNNSFYKVAHNLLKESLNLEEYYQVN
jgi:hypothetical protein